MLFTYSALTDVGVARSMQQDSMLTLPQILHDNASLTNEWHYDDINGALFAVADGMGGGAHGEIASRLVVEGLSEYVLNHKDQLISATYSLVNGAIYHANQKILDHLNFHPDDLSMGSTVILGLIQDEILNIGWVGDSRCYILSNEDELTQLSHDHSFVQSLVDEGKITREEAFDHPNRNIIHQSMGMASILPSFEKIPLDTCKMILLCSDGLNSMLRDEEIRSILISGSTPELINRALVDKANELGGEDNITSILISCHMKKKVSENITPIINVAEKKVKKSFPWALLIVGICLSVLFVLVFNFQTKNNSNISAKQAMISIPETKEIIYDSLQNDTVRDLAVTDAFYYIRLKVFSDSTQANMFLVKISGKNDEDKFEIRRSADGLYEVCLLDFSTKESAVKYLQNGLFPDAVILYKK